ncbi:MAG: UTP--glucose-1-phosphate uridylyltransferase [Armatimonadetes bacterium]|nr:UTP--glucose-1-phosphate uridylyltransferase [Armatimonadota bacterium]
MRITRAVITAAGQQQRQLPLQTLVDRDGKTRALLAILVGSAVEAGIEEVCVVVHPGDQAPYSQALADQASRVTFVEQSEPSGYGDAVLRAAPMVGDEPFLHLIGDHIFISTTQPSCVEQVMEAARTRECSVSAVVSTREGMLTRFGAVGGLRLSDAPELFEIATVIEKPTPTEAEQRLIVPGLRAGHYLCFSGLHVLTPSVMRILAEHSAALPEGARLELSPALHDLAGKERYLALEMQGLRYALDTRYGLLTAQLALALSGRDRAEVLAEMCALLAERQLALASER